MCAGRYPRGWPSARRRVRDGVVVVIVALLALAGAVAAMAAPFRLQVGDPRVHTAAELLVDGRSTPPPDGAPWQAVTLPDSWREPERWRQGVNGWYRLRWQAARPQQLQAVYLWRFSMNAAVWFNGEPVGDGGSFDEPVARNWNRPLLLRLPGPLWRDGVNELHVRLRVYPGFGHMMPVAVGPWDELAADHERRHFVQLTLGQMSAGIVALMLLAGLVLWVVQPRESAAPLFAGCCLLWMMYALNTVVRDIPVPAATWWRLVHASVDLFYPLVAAFHHRVFGVRRPRVEAVLLGGGIGCALFYALAPLPAIAQLNPLLHGVMALAGLYLLGWLTWRAWRQPGADTLAFALVWLVVTVCNAHDLMLNARIVPELWRSHFFVAHLAVPAMFLVYMAHLARRLAVGVREMQLRNVQLSDSVHAAGARLAAEQGAAAERERIYRDLHDRLGARLLSLVYSARDERQAALARQALDDMRALVGSVRQPGGLLSELATDWQLETELRCEDAGWQLDWRVAGDVAIDARRRHEIESMLRELVSNALAHSGGTRLQLAWHGAPGRLAFVLGDDGDAAWLAGGASATGGSGLPGVRQRVLALQGRVQWQRRPGGGTQVEIELPLAPRAGDAGAAAAGGGVA